MQAQLPTEPGSWNATVTGGIGRHIEVERQIRPRVGLPPHNDWIPGHFIRDHVLEASLCLVLDITRKLLNDGSRRMSIRRCVPARFGYDRVLTDGAYTAGYRASYSAIARKYTNLEITEQGRCFGFRLGWIKLLVPYSWYHELVGGFHGLLLAVRLSITHLELVLDNRDAARLIENLFLPGATYEIQVEGEEEEWIASAKKTVLDKIRSLILKHWIDEDGTVRIDVISVYREENFGADNMSHLVSDFHLPKDYRPLTRIHGEPGFFLTDKG